jgi:flavin reductase (DIM6/NTAB) family NADH-FMN oxidoreductase RutF
MSKVKVPSGKEGRILTTNPVMVITTIDKKGNINTAAFGAHMRIGRTLLVAIYPGHHTYDNIKATGEFVVNVPGKDMFESIMVVSRDYSGGVNELEKSGLTAIPSLQVKPPTIAEYKGSVECRFLWEKQVGSHAVVAGEMIAAQCDKELWDEKERTFNVAQAGVVHIAKYPQPVYICGDKYLIGKETM